MISCYWRTPQLCSFAFSESLQSRVITMYNPTLRRYIIFVVILCWFNLPCLSYVRLTTLTYKLHIFQSTLCGFSEEIASLLLVSSRHMKFCYFSIYGYSTGDSDVKRTFKISTCCVFELNFSLFVLDIHDHIMKLLGCYSNMRCILHMHTHTF